VLVLKSNKTGKFDMSDCHSLFEDVFKVSVLSFRTSSKSFDTVLLVEFCGRSSHIVCKTFFSSSMLFG